MSEAELNLELLLGRRPKSVALVSGNGRARARLSPAAVVFLSIMYIFRVYNKAFVGYSAGC